MNLLDKYCFAVPTRVVFGAGVSLQVDQEVHRIGGTRVLIITDPGVQAVGLVQGIRDTIAASGVSTTVFDEVEPNPRDTTVDRARTLAEETAVDVLVAVGGGSVIDTAKATGVLLTHGGRIQDYEGRGRVARSITPLIAIPTTSGTGSEVTFSSVTTDTRRKYKLSVNSPLATASVALLDPCLTVTLPPSVTASTGMDALTHAIEGMTATVSNPISQVLALGAIELIAKHLAEATGRGSNLEARAAMLLGSLLAGMAFANADVAAVHCMAEALGAAYDTPHGIANSVFLPYVMEYNLGAVPEKMAMIAAAMGENTQGLDTAEKAYLAVTSVTRLSKEVGIPRFRDLNIPEEDLEELAEMAARNGSAGSNPRPVTKNDFLMLFLKALEA